MSDLTDFFEGKMGTGLSAVENLASKEWHNLTHFAENAPADVAPAAKEFVNGLQTFMVDGLEWGGTAMSQWLSANGGNLATEVLNLLQKAMGASSPASAAGQTAVTALTKLLMAFVAHYVAAGTSAMLPAPAQSQPMPPISSNS